MKPMLWLIIGILATVFVAHFLMSCADYPVNIGIQGRHGVYTYRPDTGIGIQFKIDPDK